MDIPKNNLTLPLVSVIIPAYNAEAFIEKTLLSVLAQTYNHFEIIVVDDGSRDQTAEIVNAFAQADSRVILLQQSNAGVAAARNLGIAKSQGEYIAPIDADDIWYPQNLEKKVQCMLESDGSVGLIYSWSIDIDQADLLTGGFYNSTVEGEVYQALIYKYFLGNASTALIRRSCFDHIGGYNTQFKAEQAQGCEDWDLYLRIAEHYQFKVIPEFLVGYRQLASSMSCDYTEMAKSQSLVIADVQQRHPEIQSSIYNWSLSSFHLYLAIKSNHNYDYQNSLFWLFQAWKEDWRMTFLHHNFHLILLKNILQLINQLLGRKTESKLNTEKSLNSAKLNSLGMTITDIEQRMNVHKLLPSQVYERIRIKSLIN